MRDVTITHRRGEQDVTVVLRKQGLWNIVEAIDENGNPALLTPRERGDLRARAERGEDETGT